MKSLNAPDLKALVEIIEPILQGGPLQDVWTDGTRIAFEFYTHSGSLWLVLDASLESPQLGLFQEKPKLAKITKPVVLFLKAHAVPLRLMTLKTVGFDRIVQMELSSDKKQTSVQIILIPRRTNILVESEGKKISWAKPQELTTLVSQDFKESRDWTLDHVLAHSMSWWCSEASQTLDPDPGQKNEQSAERAQKALQKKQGALRKIEESLPTELEIERWIRLGEWLKWNSEPDSQGADLWQTQLSAAENRDYCFQKARDLRRKLEGGQQRIKKIEAEIALLQNGERPVAPSMDRTKVLQKAEAQARTLKLPSGVEAVMGKSAKDNLNILRKARSWDLWLHLKDYPSAHAIIFRQKEQKISEQDLHAVAAWLTQQSLSKKVLVQDLLFSALVAECRFVRPIKGHTGSVQYQNERTFKFRVKS